MLDGGILHLQQMTDIFWMSIAAEFPVVIWAQLNYTILVSIGSPKELMSSHYAQVSEGWKPRVALSWLRRCISIMLISTRIHCDASIIVFQTIGEYWLSQSLALVSVHLKLHRLLDNFTQTVDKRTPGHNYLLLLETFQLSSVLHFNSVGQAESTSWISDWLTCFGASPNML